MIDYYCYHSSHLLLVLLSEQWHVVTNVRAIFSMIGQTWIWISTWDLLQVHVVHLQAYSLANGKEKEEEAHEKKKKGEERNNRRKCC